ncbi:hypothetical protein LPJ79_000756 [Coemansia sp. RSA 1821]|nr:hypothetical protein LPJ68_002794 [Coemansia sp. RSA 1086]KAJ1752934.1 hypothetical protein LPJ79_000756 [Coemansia sp. RSA 1821]KAJ2651884.1 hypothetical protein IWW40_001432 [Coemansia sp. RSA 1250]
MASRLLFCPRPRTVCLLSTRFPTLTKIAYSSDSLSSRETKQESSTDETAIQQHDLSNDQPATGSPTVVDTAPVYSQDEADAIKPSSTQNEPRTSRAGSPGARSNMIKGRDPVVVHDIQMPIQFGKWYQVNSSMLKYNQVGQSHIPRVPRLAHGLERVLFSPGVHLLQDPNSHVYNFDPYIRSITQPKDFDFDKLTPYITSSKDSTLIEYARSRKKQFIGSTSSMTHILTHLYFAMAGGKKPDISSLSMAYADMPSRFTRGMRYPASVALRYNDGVYGIDADKSFDVNDSILMVLGKSLEKLLTSSPKEFEKYKKRNSWKVKDIPEENYHYVEADEFVLRSQLDCRDDRLPRRTFDLKTRGSLAVRMDLDNYEVAKGYQIHTMKGRLQSFEREYYDMIRSALLKYNFQTRIGNMDGIFVAYHNTARMFGFQYISRREMDEILYGNEITGSQIFNMILIVLGKLLRTVTDQYPEKDLRVTFDGTSVRNQLSLWVEVIDDEKEEIAVKRYQETGDFTTSPKPSEKAISDPFATKDPLDLQSEDDFAEELDDGDMDSVDEIYVNTEYPILNYKVDFFSTLNDQDTNEPVTIRDKGDKWSINWCMQKTKKTPNELISRYKNMRLRQATYFERPSSDTPESELQPLIRTLRAISRRNLWRNDMPEERIRVNRSRPPISTAHEHHRADKPVGPSKTRIRKKAKTAAKTKPGPKPKAQSNSSKSSTAKPEDQK